MRSSKLALFALLFATGCGPSPAQVGGAVLIAAPLVVLLTSGLQWLLLRLWNDARAGIELRLGRNLLLSATLLLPALAALTIPRAFEWSALGLWLFGTSYAGVVLLTTRLWLLGSWWPRALFGPHLLALPVFLLPAMALALELAGQGFQHQAESLWIFPGWGGMIAGPLYLLLVGEAFWRRRRLRRQVA
jgi:hypothetical protein